jgi:magnesium transporter
MLEKLVGPEIRELLAANQVHEVCEVLNTWLPADLAGILLILPLGEQVRLISTLDPKVAAATFAYVHEVAQQRLLEEMPDNMSAQILNRMAADDRTALLQDVPPEMRHRLLSLLTPEHFAVAQNLLSYGAGTIGRLMSPDFIAVRKEWTVVQVLDYVRAHGQDRETLNVIYVVDQADQLINDIPTRTFLVAPLDKHVNEIMGPRIVTLLATSPKQAAVEIFKKYDRTALPVVDAAGKLLGVVTVDDVLDVAEQRATEDIQRFGGLEALEEPYNTTPLIAMVRKRATWLVILFVGEMLTATAMGFYEDEIEKAVVLALFVPLVISSGGNSGSQAATLLVRALALSEVRLRDWSHVLRREFLSGLMLGCILGAIGFLRIAIWSAFSNIYGQYWMLIAITVGLSLIGIVLWGSLSGAMLPFLLKRLGLDPATSSAPFVATLVDVTGLAIYFSVALLVLHGTLL